MKWTKKVFVGQPNCSGLFWPVLKMTCYPTHPPCHPFKKNIGETDLCFTTKHPETGRIQSLWQFTNYNHNFYRCFSILFTFARHPISSFQVFPNKIKNENSSETQPSTIIDICTVYWLQTFIGILILVLVNVLSGQQSFAQWKFTISCSKEADMYAGIYKYIKLI